MHILDEIIDRWFYEFSPANEASQRKQLIISRYAKSCGAQNHLQAFKQNMTKTERKDLLALKLGILAVIKGEVFFRRYSYRDDCSTEKAHGLELCVERLQCGQNWANAELMAKKRIRSCTIDFLYLQTCTMVPTEAKR